VLRKPRWLATYLRSGALPDLTVPNLALAGQPAPTFFGAYGE
jgi:pre-mycofactocin synthase